METQETKWELGQHRLGADDCPGGNGKCVRYFEGLKITFLISLTQRQKEKEEINIITSS